MPQTASHLFYQKTLCHTHTHTNLHVLIIPTNSGCDSIHHSYSIAMRVRVSSPYEYTLLVYSVFKPTNCTCNHKYLLFWDIPPTCMDPYRISAGNSFTKECIYKYAFLCKWLPRRWLVGPKHVEGAAQNNKYLCLHVQLFGFITV